ncbi:MAG TPA: 5'/3'-nucleotidase SurE [bacterium]|nr:5'/3'-nucleotidase SurE [bacterium]
MRILLTNDDGIFSPGLLALVQVLRHDHRVTVAAPDRERSAVSHGLTIREPLFVRPHSLEGLKGYSISGTPADCVKLGIDQLTPGGAPDLVISGINNGPNTGINVFYSGTVAAAMEATFSDVPGIAVSIDSFTPTDYGTAADVAKQLVDRWEHVPLNPHLVLNVNVPARPREMIQGLRITRQSRIRFKDHYIRRESPGGHSYFWLDGDHPEPVPGLDLDYGALAQNWVSVTPLTADFNAADGIYPEIDRWLRLENPRTESCLPH